VLLLVITTWEWIVLLFPLWVLLVSAHILATDRRHLNEKIATPHFEELHSRGGSAMHRNV